MRSALSRKFRAARAKLNSEQQQHGLMLDVEIKAEVDGKLYEVGCPSDGCGNKRCTLGGATGKCIDIKCEANDLESFFGCIANKLLNPIVDALAKPIQDAERELERIVEDDIGGTIDKLKDLLEKADPKRWLKDAKKVWNDAGDVISGGASGAKKVWDSIVRI